jgi:hypothetical protein
MTKTRITILIWFYAVFSTAVFSHPTGDMIRVDDHVLWSYISPVDDPGHHACIMIWSQGSQPEVLIKSNFPASDYMLYGRDDIIYIIERRYIQSTGAFESRVLKMKIGEKPKEIWEWFEDEWHVGEGGFHMPSDKKIVFARYPQIYSLEKGKTAIKSRFQPTQPIYRITAVENNQFLLLAENSYMLVNKKGEVLKTWTNLLYEEISDAPLNRNQVFDADYHNGELLIAYWGNRSFDIITREGERKTLLKQEKPLTPHWVTYFNDNKILFSSRLVFDGRNPRPQVILYKSNKEQIEIWKE